MKNFFQLLLLSVLPSQAAILYVSSVDGVESDSGATWALAKASIQQALLVSAAGDTIYVDNAHAGTTNGSYTLTSPGTSANPVLILCANRASGEPPTASATTATSAMTLSSGTIAFAGYAYCEGITFKSGSGANSAVLGWTATTPWWWKYKNCGFHLNTTSATASMSIGGTGTATDGAKLQFENCVFTYGAVGQVLYLRGAIFEMRGGSLAGTAPTTWFLTATGNSGWAELRGVDLSLMGSGKNLVNIGIDSYNKIDFANCKLGSSVNITTGAVTGQGGMQVRAVNCDSSDTTVRYFKQTFQGTITHETTVVRTGGASDGATSVSRKMVTTADSKFFSPLVSDDIVIYNTSTASQTLNIAVVTDGVTLTDFDASVEVEELGTSGFPQSVFINDATADILATPANQTTDATSVWTTVGLSAPVQQQLTVTYTPTKAGVIYARVRLAKPSTTMYFDPLAIIQ